MTAPPAKSKAPSLRQPSPTPDPMYQRHIDHRPTRSPANNTTDVKRFRSAKAPVINAGAIAANIKLKQHEGLVRNRRSVDWMRFGAHPAEPDPVQAANHTAFIRSEGQTIPEQDPEHADHAQDHDALHDSREHVFGAHQSAVKQARARASASPARMLTTRAPRPYPPLSAFNGALWAPASEIPISNAMSSPNPEQSRMPERFNMVTIEPPSHRETRDQKDTLFSSCASRGLAGIKRPW